MKELDMPKRPHNINFENREKGHVTGVSKVVSSNDRELVLESSAGGLTLTGSGLKIIKFNAEEGFLSFEGVPNAFRYSAAKVPLIKRIFS